MSGLSQAVRNGIFNPALVSDARKGDRFDQASAQGIIATEVQIASTLHNARVITQLDESVRQSLGVKPGECMACGVPIPAARLKAIPSASRCVSCQEKAEG